MSDHTMTKDELRRELSQSRRDVERLQRLLREARRVLKTREQCRGLLSEIDKEVGKDA